MKPTEQGVGIVLILLGFAGLCFGLWEGAERANSIGLQPEVSAKGLVSCRLLFVVDGDTVGCDLNGNGKYDKPTELIRFLGIDTPEMHYSKKNPTYGTEHPTDEPFAKASSELAKARMTPGQTLYLEYDISRRDKRGRTLAYVYEDAQGEASPAEAQLREGLAEVLFFSPNLRHYERYQALEDEARASERGLWGHAPAPVSE